MIGKDSYYKTLDPKDFQNAALYPALAFSLITFTLLLLKTQNVVNHKGLPKSPQHNKNFLEASRLIRCVGGEATRTLAPMIGTFLINKPSGVIGKISMTAQAQLMSLVLRPVLNTQVNKSHIGLSKWLNTPSQHQQKVLVQHYKRLLNTFNIQVNVNRIQDSAQRIETKIKQLKHLTQQEDIEIEELVPKHLESLFICPITLQLLRSPCVIPGLDNVFAFEKDALEHWFDHNGYRHPILQGDESQIRHRPAPFHHLQTSIEQWLDEEIQKRSS